MHDVINTHISFLEDPVFNVGVTYIDKGQADLKPQTFFFAFVMVKYT